MLNACSLHLEETQMQDSLLKPQLRLVKPDHGPTPKLAPDFVSQLEQFRDQPQNPVIERRFAARLLNTQLFALVADASRNGRQRLAKTTYLADGNAYLPVFITIEAAQDFLTTMETTGFTPVCFSTREVMGVAEQYQLHGMLVNPGAQSLPISQSYWRYINRVLPVVDPDLGQIVFAADALSLAPILQQLDAGLSGVADIAQLWLAPMRLTAEDSLCLAVIADYHGLPLYFDTEIARKLAAVCQPLLPAGVDVLVGSLNDSLGQLVADQTTTTVLKQA
jgi:hypothetical protein